MMVPPCMLPPRAVPGAPVRAADWNAVLEVLASLRPEVRVEPPRGEPPHPWQVEVRLQPGPPPRLRIEVQAGLVNDEPATVLWQVQDDARGPLPEASAEAWRAAREARPQDAFLQRYWDRPLHEAEPPFLEIGLEVTDPGSGWERRPRHRAPAGLRAGAGEAAEFWATGVVLAAFPFNVLATVPLPKRFRVYAGRPNPPALRAARVGELLQLARVWQVREGGEMRGLEVVQDVFWHLGCMAVAPALQMVDNVVLPPVGLPLADAFLAGVQLGNEAVVGLVNNELRLLEMTLESTEFWTAP